MQLLVMLRLLPVLPLVLPVWLLHAKQLPVMQHPAGLLHVALYPSARLISVQYILLVGLLHVLLPLVGLPQVVLHLSAWLPPALLPVSMLPV
jgi:hypothetical protein